MAEFEGAFSAHNWIANELDQISNKEVMPGKRFTLTTEGVSVSFPRHFISV
jgi:hypothetical protein